MKKLLALLLAVVMLLSFAACGGNDDDEEEASTYKTAVEIYEKLLNGKSSELKKSLPKAYWDDLEENADMSYDDAKEQFEDMMDDMLDYYGDSYKAKIKILEKEKLDKDDLAELAEQICDQYDYIDEDDISEAYVLDLELSMTSDVENDTDEETYMAIKLGDDWYLVDDYGNFAMDMFGQWG